MKEIKTILEAQTRQKFKKIAYHQKLTVNYYLLEETNEYQMAPKCVPALCRVLQVEQGC